MLGPFPSVELRGLPVPPGGCVALSYWHLIRTPRSPSGDCGAARASEPPKHPTVNGPGFSPRAFFSMVCILSWGPVKGTSEEGKPGAFPGRFETRVPLASGTARLYSPSTRELFVWNFRTKGTKSVWKDSPLGIFVSLLFVPEVLFVLFVPFP